MENVDAIIKELQSHNFTGISQVIEFLTQRNIKVDEGDLLDFISANLRAYYYLPDSLAWVISEIVKLTTHESLLNINTGTWEILRYCNNFKHVETVGYDQDQISLAQYLYPDRKFTVGDPLNYHTEDKFMSVVVLMPFASYVRGRAVRTEDVFVAKALEFLKENGVAICIVPDNFLSAPIYSRLRNFVLQNYGLKSVIKMPRGLFRERNGNVSMLEISQMPCVNTKFYELNSAEELVTAFIKRDCSFSRPISMLKERWDFNFHDPHNRGYEEQLKSFDSKRVEDLVEVTIGGLFKAEERHDSGDYLLLSASNIVNGSIIKTERDSYIKKESIDKNSQRAILRDGDIVLCRWIKENICIYTHYGEENKYIVNSNYAILRGENAEYVNAFLKTEEGGKLFKQQLIRHSRVGGGIPTISVADLKNILVPILPSVNLELASERKLKELPHAELLKIEADYNDLKVRCEKLEKENASLKSHKEVLDIVSLTLTKVMEISDKIDDISETLKRLTDDFKDIKELPRSADERIARLESKLDEVLPSLIKDQKQIQDYIVEIRRWFERFDMLEAISQKYLPEAEFILDFISTKLEEPDYSPFVIQYCRAFENELLKKLFRAYLQSLIDRKIDVESAFEWDFGRKPSGNLNNEDTNKLAKTIKKCLSKNPEEWFFELGSMEFNLRYLTGNTVAKSPLLQDLKKFVLDRFEQDVLSAEYLDDIKKITKDFRNKSAHPNLISKEVACEFHRLIKECLIKLMESYKLKRDKN